MFRKALLFLSILLLFLFVGCLPVDNKLSPSNTLHNEQTHRPSPEPSATASPLATEDLLDKTPLEQTPFVSERPIVTASPSPKPITDLIFSNESGFYSQAFDLQIQAPEGATIYYTTDNTTPNTSSNKYTSPLRISDLSSPTSTDDYITVIKAVAYFGNLKGGSIKTKTYLVNQRYGSFTNRYKNLPVFSISTDEKNLYDEDIGLFYKSNYLGRGSEWERPCNISYFTSNGQLAFSQDAGMRIFGGTSRGLSLKSLRFIARKEYDPENGKFKYPLFDSKVDINGKIIDRYEAILLRAGGNDNLQAGSHSTYLRDGVIQHLAGAVQPIDFMEYQPAVVYINGKYWGIMNMRDTYDKDYVAQEYKLPVDEIAIASYGHRDGDWDTRVHEIPNNYEYEDIYNNFNGDLNWISQRNMTLNQNYRDASNKIDIDSFINYMAINIFVNNRDWPHNNARAWKHFSPNSSSSKWHFMLRDMDYTSARYDWSSGAGVESVMADETAHNRRLLEGKDGKMVGRAFGSLLKNNDFRMKFISVMCDLINEHFSSKNFNNSIDYYKELIDSEMRLHLANEWLGSGISMSYSRWNTNVNRLKDFATQRPIVMRNMIMEAYNLGTSVNLVIDVKNPSYGSVKLNTIDLTGKSLWQGRYFVNIDMDLSVSANPGRKIKSVEVTRGNATYYSSGYLKITRNQDVRIEIVFE